MGRILVVDDDPDIVKLFSIYLEKQGHEVEVASDGSSAYEKVQVSEFDVIVTDIAMPGMDGITFLKGVRVHDLDVPVIMVTGGPQIDSAIKALEYGAFRYLIKPVKPAELGGLVKRAIGLHGLARLKREALALAGDEHEKWFSDRAVLEERFDRALGSLWLAFQPIVSYTNQRAFAHEALMRNAEPSLSSPPDLLKAALRLGRMWDLGRAVRKRAARAAAVAPKETVFFVNLHAMDLEDEQLYNPNAPLAALADRVVLEITENATLDGIRDLRGRAEALRELGYRLALDDLGAGYAGLTNLAHLEPEVVKLDMSLVRGVDRTKVKQRVIGSLYSLCKDLDLMVVAEGVETEAELGKLIDLGGDLFQGFFFSRPSADLASSESLFGVSA